MTKIKSALYTSLILSCLLMQTACKPIGSHTNGLERWIEKAISSLTPLSSFSVKITLTPKERARIKAQLKEMKSTGLWTRLRAGFQLNFPENHPKVQGYIREYSRNNAVVNLLSKNASPYLFLIVEELTKKGVPLEIALLPMVESHFNPLATSPAGAQGLWQFMPETGKVLGLKQDWWYDGRRDIRASTIAAIKHLQYLHRTFNGDWLLAFAAYNSGEHRVSKAIEQNRKDNRPTDFWSLDLPKETQEYVPKLLAFVSMVRQPIRYGLTLPFIPNKPYVKSIEANYQVDLKQLAESSNTSFSELLKLNPGFHHWATHPNGPHRLLVPINEAAQLEQQLNMRS